MKEINTLDELREIELSIMKIIHKFCVENDITYYLYAGTLIGAVRHKGFIPWDDDIDIAMPRNDYEKFLKSFPEYAKDNGLQLANHKTKPYYARTFTKVIDCKTVLYELGYKKSDPLGVFVDIWPLDGLPDGEKASKKHIKHILFLNGLLYSKVTKIKRAKSLKRNLTIIGGRLLGIGIGLNKLLDKIEKVSKKYPYKNSEYVYGTAELISTSYKKEYFGKPQLIAFEDARFYAPQNYDGILKSRYGNYMKLPPEDERVPHHIVNTYRKD